MAWWDHEELKAPENRSDRYKVTFPEEFSSREVAEAQARLIIIKPLSIQALTQKVDYAKCPTCGCDKASCRRD